MRGAGPGVRRSTGILAAMQAIVMGQTKCSQIARRIEAASGFGNYVMYFEPGLTTAFLTAPAVSTQDIGPQLSPVPRAPAPGC